MSNHTTIAALKKMIESERDVESKSYQIICDKNSMHLAGRKANAMEALMSENAYYDAHEAATERFLPLIEKAVVMASYYADKKNWGEPTTDIRDWYLIESTDRGKKARDFLAEIEKEIGDE